MRPVTSPRPTRVPCGPGAHAVRVTVSPSSRKVRLPSASSMASRPFQVSSSSEPRWPTSGPLTAAQQLAHMTVNGAALRTGDLFASGTVSGRERGQRGCFLELSWGGTEPVILADGSSRTYLADGDTVTIRATAPGADGTRIGFGEVTGTVKPAAAA